MNKLRKQTEDLTSTGRIIEIILKRNKRKNKRKEKNTIKSMKKYIFLKKILAVGNVEYVICVLSFVPKPYRKDVHESSCHATNQQANQIRLKECHEF